MELKITITDQELELLPYVAIDSKVQIDPSKSQQENAQLVADALKANLMARAKQMRLEHVSRQAAAEEAARLEEIVPTEQGFKSSFIGGLK